MLDIIILIVLCFTLNKNLKKKGYESTGKYIFLFIGIWIGCAFVVALIASVLSGGKGAAPIIGAFVGELIGGIIGYIVVNNRPALNQGTEGQQTPVSNPDGQWVCPKCGNVNPNTTFQCIKCGYRLN